MVLNVKKVATGMESANVWLSRGIRRRLRQDISIAKQTEQNEDPLKDRSILKTLQKNRQAEHKRQIKGKRRAISKFRKTVELLNQQSSKQSSDLEGELRSAAELKTAAHYYLTFRPQHKMFPNPFEDIILEGPHGTLRGDISNDSSSGYDGKRKMDCWDLGENCQSTSSLMNLAESINVRSWNLTAHNFDLLVKLSQRFMEMGFQVYCVRIDQWRLGYDYEVFRCRHDGFPSRGDYHLFYVEIPM